MMHCKCGARTAVVYTKQVRAKDEGEPTNARRILPPDVTYIRRNRRCEKGHRFTTIEVNVDDLEDGGK